MTTLNTPDIATSSEAEGFGGFGNDSAPDAAPTVTPTAPEATPAAPAAEPAKAEAPAAAKPGDGSLLGDPKPTYDLKAEGVHAEDLKEVADVLGEHKVDAKAGQAILDKLLPALKARAATDLSAAQTAWKAENAKDATATARVEAALSVVSQETKDALRGEVYVNHPSLFRFVAEFGDFVKKATKQDTAVDGASPTPAPKFEPANTSAAAFAGGVASGF